jgi:hypothetical protein
MSKNAFPFETASVSIQNAPCFHTKRNGSLAFFAAFQEKETSRMPQQPLALT